MWLLTSLQESILFLLGDLNMPLNYGPSQLEYGLQRPFFHGASTAALAAGTNTILLVSIPLDEIWELQAAGLFQSTGGIAAATATLFAQQPSGVAVPLGPSVTLAATQRSCMDKKILLGPGTEIVVQILVAAIGDVVTLRMLAYKFPRYFLP